MPSLARVGRLRPDAFVIALIGTIIVATLLPCQGTSSQIFRVAGTVAIASLFFLQGARLSREAVVAGLTNYLLLGVLFLCALPSTMQSSIALTSIAQGNVAGAVCAATASSLAGILLTPTLFGAISHVRGYGAVDLSGMWLVVLQLLMPFAIGHLMRPWIGPWAARNKRLLSVTDRGSILIVVYTAFSAAVVHGIWHQLPPGMLATLGLVVAALLAMGLLVTTGVARASRFSHADEVATVICGSQKSLVSGIPIASVLFSGPLLGFIVLPIMIYHPLQLIVCAWLARRYAMRPAAGAAAALVPATA